MSAGLLNLPDRVIHRVLRRTRRSVVFLLQVLRILTYRFLSENQFSGAKPKTLQPVLALGRGSLKIDQNVTIGYFPSPGFLSGVCHLEARAPSASILIGEGTHINNEFTAIAEFTEIKLGKGCLVGPRVLIVDSDFHGLRVADRKEPSAIVRQPVDIGNDVFIGASTVILKGVKIGDGAVIGAGSVVVTDIPSNVVAAGNPAKIIRSL